MATILDNTATSGCSLKPADLPRAKPITVNGERIPRDAIARETQNHPAAKPVDAWLAAARALVVRALLVQEAHRLALVAVPVTDEDGRCETDEEALVRQLVEREVRIPAADDEACRRVYDARRAAFRSSDLFAVRHILVAAAPGDAPARDKANHEAQSIIAALESAPERFAELAAACSACLSHAQGGTLGQISRGQTVPEFEAALHDVPVGIVAPRPVETRYGYHVVAVDQRIAGEQLPFELVKEQIAAWLADRAHHTAVHQYISMLAGRAEITGIDLDGQSPITSARKA